MKYNPYCRHTVQQEFSCLKPLQGKNRVRVTPVFDPPCSRSNKNGDSHGFHVWLLCSWSTTTVLPERTRWPEVEPRLVGVRS